MALSLAIILVFLLMLCGLVILYYFHLPKRIRCDFKGKHVFITGWFLVSIVWFEIEIDLGGSKGIGKAIAEEVIARGCKTVRKFIGHIRIFRIYQILSL